MTASVPSSETYRARWVWSAGRWIENGRVMVVGRQIVAVENTRVAGEIDLGDQIILPGLVNAHTHLEFSSLAAPLPYDHTFASWIRHVVEWRRGQTDASARTALGQGIAESARAGVSLLGEITTREWDEPTALDDPEFGGSSPHPPSPQLVVFDEVLGLRPEAVPPQMSDAIRHIRVGSTRPAEAVLTHRGQLDWRPNWTAGVSPHAPYSVCRALFDEVVNVATSARCPVAMHLAETREELELLASGTGPLVDLFTEWGLWSPGQRAAFRKPLEVLQQLAVLPRVLVIHGNYLTSEELDFLVGKDQFSVVYCPRTHSYFQHDPYPLAELLKRGIRVALGTDSRASNPDLNLLSELRHAARSHPEIGPSDLLEMATRYGAEALGQGDTVGCIAPGQRADFLMFPLPSGLSDPFEAVLAS